MKVHEQSVHISFLRFRPLVCACLNPKYGLVAAWYVLVMNDKGLDIEFSCFIFTERRTMSFSEFRMALHAFSYCQRSTLCCTPHTVLKNVKKITAASLDLSDKSCVFKNHVLRIAVGFWKSLDWPWRGTAKIST